MTVTRHDTHDSIESYGSPRDQELIDNSKRRDTLTQPSRNVAKRCKIEKYSMLNYASQTSSKSPDVRVSSQLAQIHRKIDEGEIRLDITYDS